MTTYRYYKIGNTWIAWQEAHNLYGYTKTPSTSITYKSTNPSTWGDPVSPASGYYDGDISDPISGLYFSAGSMGWFDANHMASSGRMPGECVIDDTMFTDGNVISACARLKVVAGLPPVELYNEQQEVSVSPDYYLIASAINLGWHTLDEWEELGWVPSAPNTLYFGGDFSGNNIKIESVDGGGGLIDKYASYKPLFALRGWEPGGLFIDKPRMMGICGVITETSDSVVQVEVPKQLSVGRIEFTGSLAEGGIPESGVVEEYVPAPALPTVETNLGAYGTYLNGTKNLAPNDIGVLYLRNAATTAVIYDDNYLYSVYRYYRYAGTSEWRIGAFFEAVKDGTVLAAKNITNSTLDYIDLYRYATCSDTQAEVIKVLNSSNESFNAFKFTVNNTDYYYVLDNTQTDWTDDLSGIGYHLPPAATTCFFNLNGSKTNISLSYLSEYYLYLNNGDMIPYSSSVSLLGVYAADGTQVSGTFELINGFNPSGYLAIKCTSGNVTAAYCDISMGS